MWRSFLLTAAGQSRILTGFPFNFRRERKTDSKINIRCISGGCQLLIAVVSPRSRIVFEYNPFRFVRIKLLLTEAGGYLLVDAFCHGYDGLRPRRAHCGTGAQARAWGGS